jgi:hypothetical protein
LSLAQADALRLLLQGQPVAPVESVFTSERSRHQGQVQAVQDAMNRLGLAGLVAARRSPQREVVIARVVARLLQPESKLATTRWWKTTTLPDLMGVTAMGADDWYAALDWLLARQGRIEAKLAARQVQAGGLVLYDLTSSYLEGTTCPLAARGYSRDGKRGTLQINYGLLTDPRGCPVALSVFAGQTADPKTLLPPVEKVRDRLGISELVLVGDRGMLSQTQIETLRPYVGVDWITALRSGASRTLIEAAAIPLEPGEQYQLVELLHPDSPEERLIACYNPVLARQRDHQRQALLDATSQELEKLQGMMARGQLKGQDQIGLRAGKVINKYQVAKQVALTREEANLQFQLEAVSIAAERALDGLYVRRTSLPADRLDAAATVRSYKHLSRVEQAFRSSNSLDLAVRPIYHRLADRVKAHRFLCLLAYYVHWHLLEAWRPLLFADAEQSAKAVRDPVAPAQRSPRARQKAPSQRWDDGTEVPSFQTLLQSLSTVVRTTCRRPAAPATEPAFRLDTQPNSQQQRAYELLKSIPV